jgi:hypothetical protein
MSKEKENKTELKPKSPGWNPFKRISVGKSVHSLLDGTFLTKDKFRKIMPFLIFLLLLGMVYISNIFRVERTKRQIDDLEEELRELRYEYISSRSQLMYESKPSEIAIKLKDSGIRESMDPPRKIMISKDKNAE